MKRQKTVTDLTGKKAVKKSNVLNEILQSIINKHIEYGKLSSNFPDDIYDIYSDWVSLQNRDLNDILLSKRKTTWLAAWM